MFLQPTANIQTAIAQTVAVEQAQFKQMPPGATPPLVISYSASSIPVIQLGLSSPKLSEQDLNDTALNFLRPQLVTIPGAAVPYPYGGKTRLISVDLDTRALLAKGLTPSDVVSAFNAQNLILPTGTAKIGPKEYTINMNGSPATVDGPQRHPGAHAQRRDHLSARSRARARRLLAANQHRAAGRSSRRADLDPEERQCVDAFDRQYAA